MTIIGLTGVMRSGKTTVCDILRDTHGFTVIGFADALKAMAIAIDPIVTGGGAGLASIVEYEGWEDAKDRYPEVRRFLQRLGTEGVRQHLSPDAWVDAWAHKVDMLNEYDADVAVPDVRFLNEANAIGGFGGQVWRIVRPGHGSSGHASEQEMDLITPSLNIENVGDVEYLADRVRDALAYAREYQ